MSMVYHDTTVYVVVHTDPLSLPHEVIDVVGDIYEASDLATTHAGSDRFTWTPGEDRVGYASAGHRGLFTVTEFDVAVPIPVEDLDGRDSEPTTDPDPDPEPEL